MHDAIALEKRGIPTALVCSEPFIPTAKTMAKIQGIPDYPFAVVPHPVGSLPLEDIKERAKRALPQVRALLLPQ